MDFKKYFLMLFAVFALISFNNAVKVNMQGSLSLGKEVMESLTQYLKRNNIGSRRAMGPFSRDSDVLYLIIKSTYLCRGLEFCDGNLEQFLNEYIMVLTKSIETIFEEILSQREKVDEESKMVKRLVFEEELKKALREIRRMLRSVNARTKEERTPNLWIELIKKLSVMFQTAAILFATERLNGNPKEISEVKKKLQQKFLFATIPVEEKFENKLCVEYNVCVKSYECTKALDNLLGSFKDMDEEKVKIFIRYVSEGLIESKFYELLNEATANEMQIILNDMAYSYDIPTKDVLLSIHKTVADRVKAITMKTHTVNEKDVQLVHVILSDMDHVYSKRKVDPFHSFLSTYYEWSKTGIKLGVPIRKVLRDIGDRVSEMPNDLHMKLISEVKLFLELTIDPEK